MPRNAERTQTQTRAYSYSYSYAENQNWKYCPNCRKRLFEVVKGKGFTIEIKCRSCKKIITIEE